MKLTKTILEEKQTIKANKSIKIPALIASIFSVLFSLSIVVELSNIVNGIVLAFLAVFTALFLIMNERIKVKEIKQFYSGKKLALIPFVITFLISVFMSSLGVYLWTNKSFKANQQIASNNIEKITEIKSDYFNQISELESKVFEDTKEYETFQEDLKFWKTRRAANVKERSNHRKEVKNIQNKIEKAKENFNQKIESKINILNNRMNTEIDLINNTTDIQKSNINRNDNISMIFLIMILITEIGIIILNKDVAKHQLKIDVLVNSKQAENFVIARKVLETLYLSKPVNDVVNLLHALYSPVLVKLNWDDTKKFKEVKKLYNTFINIGILDSKTTMIETNKGGKVPQNKIVLNESEAFIKFDNYFEKLLNI